MAGRLTPTPDNGQGIDSLFKAFIGAATAGSQRVIGEQGLKNVETGHEVAPGAVSDQPRDYSPVSQPAASQCAWLR
jgi:hypothetical protein